MYFYMPTKIYSERDCVKKHGEEWARLGKKALIVTGRSSAVNGSLSDVKEVLESQGTGYCVFDETEANPSVEMVMKVRDYGIKENVDFVIGIGGGSPLDAAKAVAAYAADPELGMMDIFTANIEKVLPIAAIPTTAGTGSEVDQAAVLTIGSGKIKKSFKARDTFPKVAFLDAKYTETMNREYTVSTALDAFCHCVESYLSPKSTISFSVHSPFSAASIPSAIRMVSPRSPRT